MINKFLSVLFLTVTLIIISCSKQGNGYLLSEELSTGALYSRPEQIIQQFEKNSGNCQKNFILARAYRDKKEFKNALMYYMNSCFDRKYNFNIRLFPLPVYSFVDSSKGRSIFYQDAVYEIASIFYEYGEHEYVLKFTSLVDDDSSAVYRDSVILRSKSLQKLNRFNDAVDDLRKLSTLYIDTDSQPIICLRLGSLYESAGDFYKAADSYINVIKSESGVWQNSIAAKRLLYLTAEKNVKIDTTDKSVLFATALYDAEEYDKALAIADSILQKEKSPEADIIKIKILSVKNYSKALSFLKEKEKTPGYDKLLLEHANIIWDKGNKYGAVRSYDRLASSDDKKISERVLTRLSFFYEERNKPELVKYMELFIKKFPEKTDSGRFTWLIGRYYMRAGNKQKAAEYFTRGIKSYPGNTYTSYCRYWIRKISQPDRKNEAADTLIEELAVNHPDTYHALSMLKVKADRSETADLEKQFEQAQHKKDNNRMMLYHSLLFIKNGYTEANNDRIKQLDSDITGQYKKFNSLIKSPSYSGSMNRFLKKIEVYFYAGDIDAINREIKLLPEQNPATQKELALALSAYSKKFRYYNYSTYYSYKLLQLSGIKENLSLLSPEFAEALYPYAFADCVNAESRRSGIDAPLILAMMKIESNFNHSAVSTAGASGLMQLMPPTAKGISKQLGISKYDLIEPCTSIKFGANYIAWLNRYYKGQIEYMVAGYNAGAGNVDKWKARQKNRDIDYFSEFTPFDETRDYIFRTKKYQIQYQSIYKNGVKR